MKFCVYFHRRRDNLELFYIGQGAGRRPYSSTRKLKAWNDIVSAAGGFVVEIVKTGLSKREALDLEEKLILENSNKVVNKVTSSSRTKELEFNEFNDKYYIDESSPSGLRYKVNVYAGNDYCSLMKSIDDVAGVMDSNCSWVLTHNHKPVRVHRVVYLLANKIIDSQFVVDHIDGNPSNNLVSNLRLVTQAENRRNLAKDKRNVTGHTGVACGRNGENYRASVVLLNGKRVEKSFSAAKYGTEEALRLAVEWRNNMIKELNEQGAGYTDRHGK